MVLTSKGYCSFLQSGSEIFSYPCRALLLVVLLQSESSAGTRAAEHPPRRLDQGLRAGLPEERSKEQVKYKERDEMWNHGVDVFDFLM